MNANQILRLLMRLGLRRWLNRGIDRAVGPQGRKARRRIGQAGRMLRRFRR